MLPFKGWLDAILFNSCFIFLLLFTLCYLHLPDPHISESSHYLTLTFIGFILLLQVDYLVWTAAFTLIASFGIPLIYTVLVNISIPEMLTSQCFTVSVFICADNQSLSSIKWEKKDDFYFIETFFFYLNPAQLVWKLKPINKSWQTAGSRQEKAVPENTIKAISKINDVMQCFVSWEVFSL